MIIWLKTFHEKHPIIYWIVIGLAIVLTFGIIVILVRIISPLFDKDIVSDSVAQICSLNKNSINSGSSEYTQEVTGVLYHNILPIDNEPLENHIDKLIEDTVPGNSPTVPFDVSDHFRHLPDGWHPSAENIAKAAENGIELPEGCSYIPKYTKNNRI